MNPPTQKPAKWIVGVLGAVLVGAIGSGVWSSAVGPLLQWLSRAVLNIASFGFHSYKNNVYETIARENIERINIEVYALLVLAALLTLLIFADRWLERRFDDSTTSTVAFAGLGKFKYLYIGLLVVLFAFAGTLEFVNLLKFSYVNSALSHYHQVLKIAAPYLDTQSRLEVESKFAQIRNREDYVTIISNLAKVAEDHGQQAPGFDSW